LSNLFGAAQGVYENRGGYALESAAGIEQDQPYCQRTRRKSRAMADPRVSRNDKTFAAAVISESPKPFAARRSRFDVLLKQTRLTGAPSIPPAWTSILAKSRRPPCPGDSQ